MAECNTSARDLRWKIHARRFRNKQGLTWYSCRTGTAPQEQSFAIALFLRVIFFLAYCEVHSFIVHSGAGGNFTETMNYSYCKHSFFPRSYQSLQYHVSLFSDRVLIAVVSLFTIEITIPNFVAIFPFLQLVL